MPRSIAARKMRGGRTGPGFATCDVEELPIDLLVTLMLDGNLNG
jgi:hypothetical protein